MQTRVSQPNETAGVTDAGTRLSHILARIDEAQKRFGPPPDKVQLIAVSKTFDATDIEPMLIAGQRRFGENRVQEAQAKWPKLTDTYPDLELHLIGPLQTNKVKDAVALFDVIETLDRDKLARALAVEMERAGRQLPCFVQVNIGGEDQKAGIAVADTVAFVARCKAEHGLNVIGLMCIPPAEDPPGPYFAQLAELAKAAGVDQLSMGMSGDFETAIAMGATHVRVGSALFGARPSVG